MGKAASLANLGGNADTPLMFRNKLINGDMAIAQRGTSFAAAANGTYTVDRFAWNTVGAGVVTLSQQADAPSSNEFQYSLRVAVTTADASIASGDLYAVYQRIEGFNVRDLIGRTFTLSFWVRSAKTGTHCVAFSNSAGDRSYVSEYTVSSANTWEYKTVTVSGGLITAGTWDWTSGTGLQVRWGMAVGSTFQTTAGAWQTGNFYGTSNQVNVMDTNSNIFAITGAQLEIGNATPFEHRHYGTELQLCQRYYERLVYGSNGMVTTCQAIGTTTAQGPLFWKVSKRSAPTMTLSGTTGVFQLYKSTGSVSDCTITFAGASQDTGWMDISGATGLVAGNATLMYANGSGRYIELSSEL